MPEVAPTTTAVREGDEEAFPIYLVRQADAFCRIEDVIAALE
jgi:hypothetical protein